MLIEIVAACPCIFARLLLNGKDNRLGYSVQRKEPPVTIKAVLANCVSIISHQSNMSSDSSLGVALVTGASTDIGRAIALHLAAKNFDIAINDLPEALKPLEALKAQIEKEGRKSTIIAGDPLIESFWACIKPTIDAHRGHTETIVRAVRSPALWGK
ncbi:hypothetical protein C0992_008547, partial [Termitomyces sp. T32_za158]